MEGKTHSNSSFVSSTFDFPTFKTTYLQLVRRRRLLNREPKERPLIVPHEPEPTPGMGVIPFPTPEVTGDSGAAVKTDSPKIVALKSRVSIDNRRNTVQIQVLEAHRPAGIKTGVVGEVDLKRRMLDHEKQDTISLFAVA